MKVSQESLENLELVQQIDLKALKVRSDLESLPQREGIVEARKKAGEFEKKLQQLNELAHATQEKLQRKLTDQQIAQGKAAKVEEEIASAAGDYRRITAKTKELDSLSKRIGCLETEQGELAAEVAKIESLQKQVEDASEKIKAEEEKLTASFVREGTALKQALALAEQKKVELARGVPAELYEQYEKIAQRTGGVALAQLKGGACGACRATLDHGRLIALRSQGNVGLCPHCGRLLVLHEPPEG